MKFVEQLGIDIKNLLRKYKLLIKLDKFIFGFAWYEKHSPGKDTLERGPHAKNIAREIINNFDKSEGEDETSSYVFAISGRWGEGKSDLLNRIKPKLIKNRIPVVIFRPWQYTENPETLRRVFLNNLNRSLNSYRNILTRTSFQLSNLGFLDRLVHDESKTSLNKRLSIIVLLITGDILLAISISQLLFFGQIDLLGLFNKAGLFIKSNQFISYLTGILTIGAILPQLLKIQRSQSKISSVDEFEELFNKCIGDFTRIVIFIDDLDRCTPEGVKIVLDSLKTFFKNPNVNYIVTGDHTVIERYLGEQLYVSPVYKDDDSGVIDEEKTDVEEELEGKRFLKKLFNVYWRLPLADQIYTRKLINEYLQELDISTEEKSRIETLMSSFLDRNPRELKRFIELLSFSLKTIKTRLDSLPQSENNSNLYKNLMEVNSNTSLLSKILIIQEKFDIVFREYSAQPSRYATLEREQLSGKIGYETNFIIESLGEDSNFLSLVKTEPTFHNQTLTLIYSPENFFFYSGFAGATEKGVLSEDFLNRYITGDTQLITDLQGNSDDRKTELVQSGIVNITNLNDPPQLSQAITNLRMIFIEFPATSVALENFLNEQKVKDFYSSLPEDQKDLFIREIWQATLKSKTIQVANKLLSEDPWKSKKQQLWEISNLDTSAISDDIFNALINDTSSDENAGIDISQKRQKIVNDHLNRIKSDSQETDDVSLIAERMNTYSDSFKLKDFATAELFRELKALNKTELARFLNTDNPFWAAIKKDIRRKKRSSPKNSRHKPK